MAVPIAGTPAANASMRIRGRPSDSDGSTTTSLVLTRSGARSRAAVMLTAGLVLVAATAFDTGRLNRLFWELQDCDVDLQITSGTNDIVLATKHGLSVRFHESDVRDMGRDTTGVKGVELRKGDSVVGMVVIKREATLLVVTEKGLGKCSPIDDYRVQKRGGKGIITVQRTVKTGNAVSIKEVLPDDELMLITQQGKILRMASKDIRTIGRATQGVRLIDIEGDDRAVSIARLAEQDDDTPADAAVLGAALFGDVHVCHRLYQCERSATEQAMAFAARQLGASLCHAMLWIKPSRPPRPDDLISVPSPSCDT